MGADIDAGHTDQPGQGPGDPPGPPAQERAGHRGQGDRYCRVARHIAQAPVGHVEDVHVLEQGLGAAALDEGLDQFGDQIDGAAGQGGIGGQPDPPGHQGQRRDQRNGADDA